MTRLQVYERLLRKWQATINLVAPKTLDEVWERHFLDSAQLWRVAQQLLPADERVPPKGLHWLDLGSGGGFPGLVVGLVAVDQPGQLARLTLIESDQRKAAFLREVARETGLKDRVPVDIVVARIEASANHLKVRDVDVVTARALAPLPKLLDWALPYFGPATLGLFLKGREAEAEVADVPASLAVECARYPSMTDIDAAVVAVQRKDGAA
jgi:16S rRNA (guanine527-N7)-methyltransferase